MHHEALKALLAEPHHCLSAHGQLIRVSEALLSKVLPSRDPRSAVIALPGKALSPALLSKGTGSRSSLHLGFPFPSWKCFLSGLHSEPFFTGHAVYSPFLETGSFPGSIKFAGTLFLNISPN